MTELNFYGDGQELRNPMHLKKCVDGDVRFTLPACLVPALPTHFQVCKGPFKLSDWFFFYLLRMDVLRLESVTASFDFFNRRHQVYRASKDKSPAESFARLLLFRGNREERRHSQDGLIGEASDSTTCMKRAAAFDLVNVELRLNLMTLKDSACLFGEFPPYDRITKLC